MKQYILSVLSILTLLTVSCNNDPIVQQPTNEISDFTWKAMNVWYNWQEDVPNLADTKDDDVNSYNAFLNGFSTAEDLFDDLLFDPGNTDRFSWFIDDYVAQQQAFQGITKSFGFRLQAVQINNEGSIIVYVRYVSPGSPADIAGIERGDIFNALDGIVLNASNYSANVGKLSNETVTISFVENDGITEKEDKTITSTVVSDNPVYLTKVFDNIGGKKVGYLVYNGFRSSYNDELNAAFATLKNEGIQELILDLRLNGGGSVRTSAYLASMVIENANIDTFAELTFNSKRSVENSSYSFENTLNIYDVDGNNTGTESINRLTTLNKVYVLTSGSTASASEMIINGLKPFMTVKTVGTTTYGKNVGSITLYDSGPTRLYTDQATANPNHKNAMQPIVFQIFNKNGQSDYTQGFNPDIEVVEFQFWDAILPFGDENEVVLNAALNDIAGTTTKSALKSHKNAIKKRVKPLETKFENDMYIENILFDNK